MNIKEFFDQTRLKPELKKSYLTYADFFNLGVCKDMFQNTDKGIFLLNTIGIWLYLQK